MCTRFSRSFLAVSMLLIFNGCALYYSKPVTDAVNADKLRIGMSPQEVRKAAGSPDDVSKRQVNGQTREVWTYYEYGPNLRGCTVALFSSSCCSAPFVPFKAKLQYVEFQNEKLIGWNLPDPFAKAPTVEETNKMDELNR